MLPARPSEYLDKRKKGCYGPANYPAILLIWRRFQPFRLLFLGTGGSIDGLCDQRGFALRDRNSNTDHFDLLPFIAILMCVLGCLLLVTMSVAALSIGPSVGEGWLANPKQLQTAKTPVLIEWDGTVATFHFGNLKKSVKWSSPSRIRIGGTWFVVRDSEPDAERQEFERLLDAISDQSDTTYALFAVRPSGFGNLYRFANEFRSRKINVGYEPIDQNKAVRLLQKKGAK